jgi:hypothetical protein
VTSDRLSESIRERNERAEGIVLRLDSAGWEVTLSTVLRNFAVFDRWALGRLTLGYLVKMTGIKRKPLSQQPYDAIASFRRQMELVKCACLPVIQAFDALTEIAEHIRSIQCEACGKIWFTSDVFGSKPEATEG